MIFLSISSASTKMFLDDAKMGARRNDALPIHIDLAKKSGLDWPLINADKRN